MELGSRNLARFPLLLADHAERLGLSRVRLLEAAGLGEADLEDPDCYVPTSGAAAAWRYMIDHAADPALAIHLAESIRVRELGLLGYGLACSASLREALGRLVRYGRVLSTAIDWQLQHDSRGARVVTKGIPILDSLQQPVDVRLAFVVRAAREITEADIVPREVCFPYAAPADTTEHCRFFGCPLRFERPEPAVVFDTEDLDRAVPASDETLVAYLEQLAEGIARSLSEDGSFTHRIRHAIWRRLSEGTPSREQIAEDLGVGVRTLQRRLASEGTTFKSVLNNLRHGAAVELLRNHSLSVAEIAFMLGYADPRNFYRGFRRWEGRPPSAHRRALSGR